MKRNKNYFSIIGMVLACGVLITSCADNFAEEELLLRQQERSDRIAADEAAAEAADEAAEEALSAENAAALTAAANVTYTISLHSDNVPAADVAVTLTNQNGGGTTSIVTDANGNAAFVDIDLGGYNVSIVSNDYLDSSYLVDFGSPQDGVHYEWINGSIVALEQSEASKIELLELNGMQTATITGTVEIETDLTNDTPEVPQEVTIRANLDNFGGLFEHTINSANGNNNGGDFYIFNSYSLTEGDIGSAVVDANTGEYSMQVPAQEDGTVIDLLIPLVEADQTLGFSSVDGQDVGVQVGTQAAVFGPDITATTTPTIEGVVAQFPEPEAPGRGFTVGNFTTLPRTLSTGVIDNFPLENDLDDIQFRGNPGSDDFQLSPLITVSDPEITDGLGDTAEIVANMSWALNSFDLISGGNFAAFESVEFVVRVVYSDATTEDFPTGLSRQANNAGTLTPVSYTDIDIPFNTSKEVVGITITQDIANSQAGVLNVNNIGINGSITGFELTNAGHGYTSVPTITVGNQGSPTTRPSLEISEMAFQYTFDLDNSGVTQGYVVLPDVSFELENAIGAFNESTSVTLVTLDADGFQDLSAPQDPLTDGLMVSNGDLVFNDDLFSANVFAIATVDKGLTGYSYSEPNVIIVEPIHEQTTADVDVNNDGEITGLFNIIVGSGYTSEYDVTLVTQNGLPGAGAVLDLINFATTSETGEVTWGGNDVIVVESGSGYTEDVNISREFFSAPTFISLKNGETKIVNINYGTGDTVSDVD
ncbi:carboxypeptidase-like regulatory domain-containing protein [Flagellimonas eckloniae]|nr:carboxypeptidase-like regulatory domain-containing protein [Allomuricauda eckloniae]